jgi:hypothetical protein
MRGLCLVLCMSYIHGFKQKHPWVVPLKTSCTLNLLNPSNFKTMKDTLKKGFALEMLCEYNPLICNIIIRFLNVYYITLCRLHEKHSI